MLLSVKIFARYSMAWALARACTVGCAKVRSQLVPATFGRSHSPARPVFKFSNASVFIGSKILRPCRDFIARGKPDNYRRVVLSKRAIGQRQIPMLFLPFVCRSCWALMVVKQFGLHVPVLPAGVASITAESASHPIEKSNKRVSFRLVASNSLVIRAIRHYLLSNASLKLATLFDPANPATKTIEQLIGIISILRRSWIQTPGALPPTR